MVRELELEMAEQDYVNEKRAAVRSGLFEAFSFISCSLFLIFFNVRTLEVLFLIQYSLFC